MRKYTGVLQYFHNFEHDPLGRNHCDSEGKYPYSIEHVNGKHKISRAYAKGHGRGCKPQWFHFTEKLGAGYNMASGVKINKPPKR